MPQVGSGTGVVPALIALLIAFWPLMNVVVCVSLPAAVPVVLTRPLLPLVGPAGEAEARTQVTLEVVGDDHDARLDQHLAHRDVQRRHQAADVGEPVGGVLQQQRVGAVIDRDVAARGQQVAVRRP